MKLTGSEYGGIIFAMLLCVLWMLVTGTIGTQRNNVVYTTEGGYTRHMFERCLYFNLNAVTRRVNKIWEQAFNDLGLSPAHAYLLRVVLASPGITQQGIANELRLERSTVTRFVEALESRGYLLRNKSGRERLVYPTQAARVIADGLEQRGNALFQRMVDSLGEDAVVQLVGDLRSAGSKLS